MSGSVHEAFAEIQDIIPYGLLAFFVEYLVAHGGVEAGPHICVSGPLHGADGLAEFPRAQQAGVILTGDEEYGHGGVAGPPSGDTVGILHDGEEIEEAVGRELEVAQRVGVVVAYDLGVGADPGIG